MNKIKKFWLNYDFLIVSIVSIVSIVVIIITVIKNMDVESMFFIN